MIPTISLGEIPAVMEKRAGSSALVRAIFLGTGKEKKAPTGKCRHSGDGCVFIVFSEGFRWAICTIFDHGYYWYSQAVQKKKKEKLAIERQNIGK